MPSLTLQGAKNTATVFTHNIEETAIGQVIGMLNEPITKNTTVAIMPDVHAGIGSTIGTTIRLPENKTDWKVCPNVVGVDIGCSMRAIRITDDNLDLEKLDQVVNEKVPAGQKIHDRVVVNQKEIRTLLKGLSFRIDQKTTCSHHEIMRNSRRWKPLLGTRKIPRWSTMAYCSLRFSWTWRCCCKTSPTYC